MSRGRIRWCAAILAVFSVVLTTAAPVGVAPVASAASCPDAELIFARGRMEPPGAGQIGNALVTALRQKTKKNITLYSVNYPADTQIDMGANDMSRRIQSTMTNCPKTPIVLGGYSLGAAATDVVLAMPFPILNFKLPLPATASPHIVAIALFGNGIQWVAPITQFNPAFQSRTIELCHGNDPICNPTDMENWQTYWPEHLAPAYIKAGMVNKAANFVAGKLV